MGDGIGHIVRMVIVAVKPAAVVDVLLGAPGNGGHGRHRLHRVLACRTLPRQHDGTGAVVDGIGHIAGLRPGGTGVVAHRFQHLGGCDNMLARHIRLFD